MRLYYNEAADRARRLPHVIAKGLLWLLEFFQKYVNNWGVAIILLTVLIKALFWPLTAKSYASMEKMKKLQPHMTVIREKYKDDKELMNKEVMALYKTYGVNPASGCVPILIQMPVFFGLYQALLTSIELRHAPFISYLPGTDIIWLADLSAKDPFYITPIVMGLTMPKVFPPRWIGSRTCCAVSALSDTYVEELATMSL